MTLVVLIAVLALLGLVIAGGLWYSRHSPAGYSDEDTLLHPQEDEGEGMGRPAGPDAEAMGVLDPGEAVTEPPPPDGVPTDAPPHRPAPRRRPGPRR
jgi:hypothetical protein